MRLLVPLAAILYFVIFVSSAFGQDVYIRNQSSLPQSELVDALPAFQRAVDEDFGPAWNTSARLRLDAPLAGSWVIDLVDAPDCIFCAGYHTVKNHRPYGVVGVADDDPQFWQLVFTHELFEILADPFANRGALVKPSKVSPYRWYALEVCDPVEALLWAYRGISASGRAVYISDFVTEDWFRRGSKGPFDFTHKVSRPLKVLEDGYQLVWSGGDWVDRLPKGRD
jgi:hypothetical protein